MFILGWVTLGVVSAECFENTERRRDLSGGGVVVGGEIEALAGDYFVAGDFVGVVGEARLAMVVVVRV